MSDSTPKPTRPWRLIAEEASREDDPQKAFELMEELRFALEEGIQPEPDASGFDEASLELQKKAS